MLHILQWLRTYVSKVCSKCFYQFQITLQVVYLYVANVCFKFFVCFRLMLQLFYLNVVKVDLNVDVKEAQALVVQLLWLPWCGEDGDRRHGSGGDGMSWWIGRDGE